MDGGRLKWEKEGRELTPRDADATPPTQLQGAGARRHDDPRLPRRGAAASSRSKGQLVDVRSPDEYTGKRLHMPEYPNEGALRGGHIPGAKSVPWAQGRQPRGRHVQERRRAADALRRGAGPRPGEDGHRLLPHRRAQQPHLVRAHLPARLPERAQLRRQLDGVGQLGRRADREVSDSWIVRRSTPEACRTCSTRSRRSTITSERAQVLHRLRRRASRRCRPRWPRGPSRRTTWCPPASRRPTSGRGCSRTARCTLHFAVENPSGISAKALAAMLTKTLSGLHARGDRDGLARDRRAAVPPEHLDGQGHGPDVDGRRRAHAGAARAGHRAEAGQPDRLSGVAGAHSRKGARAVLICREFVHACSRGCRSRRRSGVVLRRTAAADLRPGGLRRHLRRRDCRRSGAADGKDGGDRRARHSTWAGCPAAGWDSPIPATRR